MAIKTILVVDVSGSTRLYHEAGNEVAHQIVEACVLDAAARVAVLGRIVKFLGDGFFALLPDLDSALRSCKLANEVLSSREDGLGLRMGLYSGDVIETESDAFGDAVNMAFRISDFATSAQITAVAETVHLLPVEMWEATQLLGAVALRGKPDAYELYDLSPVLRFLR